MSAIVAKFGGSSLADAGQIRKVVDIIKADPRRKFIVVSAPGKRHSGDTKITDLLRQVQSDYDPLYASPAAYAVSGRFAEIIKELCLDDFSLDGEMRFLTWPMEYSFDFIESRGEYLMAKILAKVLGWTFIDASDLIKFTSEGVLDMEATRQSRDFLLSHENGCVIPGYYGAMPDGAIKTLPRGGSDLTGAIVSVVIGAELNENWTDVSGFRMTDPRIVPEAKHVDIVTYSELRELTYMGANVLHDAVALVLKDANIPLVLRNTNKPEDEGTLIVPDEQAPERRQGSIVGIAGRRDFTIIKIAKSGMNEQLGFIHAVTGAFLKHEVSIEHMPSGIDTLSVVVATESLNGKLPCLVTDLEPLCNPNDGVSYQRNIALICTVGHAMARTPGVAGKLTMALGNAGVNIRMIDQGSSELNIIIGVDGNDYETAIRAIYAAFADI